MIRELHTRFGRENIGFLWMMVEPLLFAVLVAIVWRFMKGPTEHGMGIAAFAVTGYIPITLFRHCVGRSVAIFTANGSLLYHRQVKIEDFIAARVIIEVLGSMMAFVFIGSILLYFDEFPLPQQPGLFIAGWLLYCAFTFSICLVIAPLSEMSEALEKVVPVVTYIILPFSGLFTMASWLSPQMRAFMLMSPFVDAMEMMRGGIWGDQITVYYSIWNPLGCSLVTTFFGLALCRRIRRTLAVA